MLYDALEYSHSVQLAMFRGGWRSLGVQNIIHFHYYFHLPSILLNNPQFLLGPLNVEASNPIIHVLRKPSPIY